MPSAPSPLPIYVPGVQAGVRCFQDQYGRTVVGWTEVNGNCQTPFGWFDGRSEGVFFNRLGNPSGPVQLTEFGKIQCD